MTGGLPRRYARALLELSPSDALDVAGEELGRAAATFDEPRLRAVVLNPGIDATARRRVVREVVASLGLSTTIANLVRLLADRDRLPILPDIARSFEALVDQKLGRSRVRIRSAAALTPGERTELTNLARRLVGGDEVIATSEVDDELIGGVVLDVGGTVYDGSVRTQLTRLGTEMDQGGS